MYHLPSSADETRTMRRSSFKWLLVLILILSLANLACFAVNYTVTFYAEGTGAGVVQLEFLWPKTISENPNLNQEDYGPDSIMQSLKDSGWENVAYTETEDGRYAITASYPFDPVDGGERQLADIMPGFTFTKQESESGHTYYTFAGEMNNEELAATWVDIEKAAQEGIKTDTFPGLFSSGSGGEIEVMSAAEVQAMIDKYGPVQSSLTVILPGQTPVSASPHWNNRDDYEAGITDALFYNWDPGQPAIVQLEAVQSSESESIVNETVAAEEQLTVEPEPTEEESNCQDWCQDLDPIGFWIPGDETPPNCTCDCGPDAIFFQQGCAPCATLCQGEGQQVYGNSSGGCTCLCTNPLEKWDRATGECVPVGAEEQGETNRCEIELGENCQNSSDCGCSFTSPNVSDYNKYLRCEPENARADIFGCVFEGLDDQEMLSIVREEYDQCTDAWLMMLLPNSLADSSISQEELNAVMGGMSGLDQVSNWQQKSGCLPSDNYGPSGGVVVGQEASDPLVCLMEYCRRVVGGAVRALENRTGQERPPVVRGPGIKLQSHTATSPENHLERIGLNAVRAYGGFDLYGDRKATVETRYGIPTAHSVYLLQVDEATGFKAYLFEGSMTYYYFHEGQIRSVKLDPGQMFSTDADGVPGAIAPFDPTALEDWWSAAEYVVDCPANAHQEGPDCYCDSGFEAAPDNEVCVPSDEISAGETSSSGGGEPIELVSDTIDSAAADNDYSSGIVWAIIAALCLCACTGGVLLIGGVVWLLRRKRS